MPRTPEEVAQLIADAWDLYQRDIPRISQTVDLTAAGFGFGQPQAIIRSGQEYRTVPILVDTGLLRRIGVNLFVAGAATASVAVEHTNIRLTPGDGCSFAYREGGRDMPPGKLWSVAVNHEALLTVLNARNPGVVSAASYIASNILLEMLPADVLSTEAASKYDADQLNRILFNYKGDVERMKEVFGAQLERCLEPHFAVDDVVWDPPWFPTVGRRGGASGLGHVYQVFKREGIDLINLRNGVMELISSMKEVRLISGAEASAIRESFGD
jgi:hypothetical protein